MVKHITQTMEMLEGMKGGSDPEVIGCLCAHIEGLQESLAAANELGAIAAHCVAETDLMQDELTAVVRGSLNIEKHTEQ